MLTIKLRSSWQSFRSLPVWVQVWVGLILVPSNAAAFFLLDYWSGRMAALAALIVVCTNIPIMIIAGGMSKLMSVPHLFAWLPLQLALFLRLTGHAGLSPLSTIEQTFSFALLLVNGVSLVFDSVDSWRWIRGDRVIPGRKV